MPEFFFPSTEPTMDVAIGTSIDPASIGPSIRDAIRSTYANAIVLKMETVEEMFGDLTAQRRFQAWLMGAFAAAALFLSAVGIFAILHFTVSQRQREFGVRIALGATRGDLFRLIVAQGLRFPAIGVAAGSVGAFTVTRLIEHLLFQVSPTDPLTFGGVAALLMGVPSRHAGSRRGVRRISIRSRPCDASNAFPLQEARHAETAQTTSVPVVGSVASTAISRRKSNFTARWRQTAWNGRDSIRTLRARRAFAAWGT